MTERPGRKLLNKPITNIAQVTPAWLTERLRSNGHLTAPQEVTNVEIESPDQNRSNIVAHLNVAYSSGVTDPPDRLFFKMGDAGIGINTEVGFINGIL